MFDELLHVLQSKHLAFGRKKELFHVLAPHAESSSGNTGDHLSLEKPLLN